MKRWPVGAGAQPTPTPTPTFENLAFDNMGDVTNASGQSGGPPAETTGFPDVTVGKHACFGKRETYIRYR